MRTTSIAFCSILLLACGSDSPSETTQIISASEGATIDVANATIEIPANAVAQDTEVTVTVGSVADYEPLDNARDVVIEFEPFVVLEASASITIDVGSPAPAENEFAFLSQFIDGVWIGVDSSTVIDSDGNVQSAINRLAPTAVVVSLPDAS